jgi:hypothetical protein
MVFELDWVILSGLERAELNGRYGRVIEAESDGRVGVQLVTPHGDDDGVGKKVKPERLSSAGPIVDCVRMHEREFVERQLPAALLAACPNSVISPVCALAGVPIALSKIPWRSPMGSDRQYYDNQWATCAFRSVLPSLAIAHCAWQACRHARHPTCCAAGS